jgi:peroxiredoxin
MDPVMTGLLLVVPLFHVADDPRTATPRERFEALRKQYDAAGNESSSGDPRDRARAACAPFLKLARENPGDPAAAEALLWVIQHRLFAPEAAEAMSLLARDHIRSEGLAAIIREIDALHGDPFDPMEKLFRAAIERSPHREVRGWATLALGHSLVHRKEKAEREDAWNTLFQNGASVPFAKRSGLTDADLDKLAHDAAVLFEQVARTYPEHDELRETANRELLAVRTISVGKAAPEIEGKDLDGNRFRLSEHRGKVVVLDFWNHESCGICRAMYPQLRSLAERMKGKPFALLGVDSDDDAASLRKLVDEGQVTWRFWCDGDSGKGPIVTRWNVNGWPTTYVLDARGVIRYKNLRAPAALESAVNILLRELEAEPKQSRRDVNAQRAEAVAKEHAPREDESTRRARELIYLFRTHRVFCRDEEWGRTIRELATIGKPAVPELIAELDRTDRDATIRSLAFTLRAIGDPRAVPALIRAIPKALRPPGSDCGVYIVDPDLRRFMNKHQNYKNDQDSSVAIGRPVNEILSALERLTSHREPPDVGDNDPLRHMFLGGTPPQQAQQRAQFEARKRRWEAWWSEHFREFVSEEELRSAELPRREEDVVEKAGIAWYGPLFPTGEGVRLGPIRMLRLQQSNYWNGKSHLDFDTGRVLQQYEGMKAEDWGRQEDFQERYMNWHLRNGIDVRCQGGVSGEDLKLWLIDDRRWETIDEEVRKGGTLELGREATEQLQRFDRTWTDFKPNKLATFLFTTREGGRGIVQVFPKDQDTDRYRVRYRMWLSSRAEVPAARPPGPEPPRTPFGKTITTTLELPAEGKDSFLDLDTGRKSVPPKFLTSAAFANPWSLQKNEPFTRWCRDQKMDVFGHLSTPRPELVPAGVESVEEIKPEFSCLGLDMLAAQIVPITFDEVTVEEARDILGRSPHGDRSPIAWMSIDNQLIEKPATFVFRTREGAVGVLQVEKPGKEASSWTIRYRLDRPN